MKKKKGGLETFKAGKKYSINKNLVQLIISRELSLSRKAAMGLPPGYIFVRRGGDKYGTN